MGGTLIGDVAQYASSLRYEDVPEEVVEKAKVCLLDFLGIAAGGYEMEVSQLAIRTMKHLAAPGSATILMDGHKGRAIDSVVANSVLAHSYMQDDWLQVCMSHVGIVVGPTVLTIAEELGNSGRDVLLATVVGHEVEARAGVLSVSTFKRGFRASGVYSYFGSASTAAKLMGLSAEQFKNALGCAGSMAGGLLQPWIDGSMEWAFEEAFGCRGGILAALLAQQGLRGADNILEGPCGVNNCFAGTFENQEDSVKGLGKDFHILNTCFKPFPSGGVNQESIALAVDLAKRHKIDYRKIHAVRVKIPPQPGTTERMDYAGIAYQGPFKTMDQCLISKFFALAAGLKNAAFDIDIVRAEKR
jgi:2-methylcitrate dehydratase PrpD